MLSLVLVTFDVQCMIVYMRQEPEKLLVELVKLVARLGGDGSEISIQDIEETDIVDSF